MDLTTLRDDTRFISRTTTTDYPNTDLNRNINKAYQFFTMKVLEAQDSWDFQGQVATANLVADQQTYSFPADILKIKRIDINFTGNSGDWKRVKIFDISQDSQALDTTSIAANYNQATPQVELFRTTLKLFPIPDINVTAGLKIWYSEEITELSDDADEPEIEEAFHKGLSYSAALDYFIRKGIVDQANVMRQQIRGILALLNKFYAQRAQDEILTMIANSKFEEFDNES